MGTCVTANPRVTAGLICPPLMRPETYTPIATAIAQPVVITIQPEFSALLLLRTHRGNYSITQHDQEHCTHKLGQKRVHAPPPNFVFAARRLAKSISRRERKLRGKRKTAVIGQIWKGLGFED